MPSSQAVVDVIADPEVIAAMASLIVVVISVVVGAFRLLDKKLRKRLDQLQDTATDVRHIASVTHEQVANTHKTNLRDDLDVLQRDVTTLTGALAQVSETIDSGFKRMDHQFGEVRDRQTQTERRIAAGEERGDQSHSLLWDELKKLAHQ